MSHGGGENEGVREKSVSRTASQKRNHFGRDLTKISVAQICESAGFQSFQLSALDTLSDVAIRYLQSIAKSVQTSANGAGRGQANIFDILQSLEEHQTSQGFASASNIHHCLATSGAIKGIVHYVSGTEISPFAYTLPSIPLTRERVATPSFSQVNEKPPAHIPPWLPAFPDRQKLRCDSSSRIAWSACNGPESILDNKNEREVKLVNPFLMPPLPSISKQACDSLPEINDNSKPMFYAAPLAEKDGKMVPYDEEKRRPIVQFKFAAKRVSELKRKPLAKVEKKVRINKAVNNSFESNGELA